jgi:hypothetical protein
VTHHFDSQAFVRRMEVAGMARGVAEELADALGSVVLDGLATRRDVDDAAARVDGHLRETELRLRQDSKDMELRLTLRLGVMLAASAALIVAILGALITLK